MTKKYYYSFTLDLPTGGFPAEHPTDNGFIGGYYDMKELIDMTELILSYTQELIKCDDILIDDSSRLVIERYDSEEEALDFEIYSYFSYEYNLFVSRKIDLSHTDLAGAELKYASLSKTN